MSLLVRGERLLRPLIQKYHRFRRGMTLGVRGLVLDAEGRVLLVEHTYVGGLYFPGGGVERGETAEEALARELVEEAGVRLTGPARLMKVHNDERRYRGDHVLIYRVDRWEACAATSRGEIRRTVWARPDAIPDEATRATRAHIEDILGRGA